MAVRLTETAIRAALASAAKTGRRFDLADALLPGLRLRLTPAGSATWALACRDPHGRMRRFPLGAFPAMGVAEARDRARALRVRVREGEDPIAERRRVRAQGRDAKAGLGTLAAALDLYAAGPGAAQKTWRETRRKVELVFATHLGRPLAAITAAELQMAADAYRSKATAGAAVRYLRPILKWAAKRGYAGREAALIEPPATPRRRDRVLSRQELAALLPALSGAGRPYRLAMLFMLLTLARREEVAGARWRDVDLEAAEWRIPAANAKNGVEHRVPLPCQAVELLRALGPGAPRTSGSSVHRRRAATGD